MPNQYFQFKKFSIFQDRCAMKVGTDGVLLGAWANTANASKILDIGTGTGLIALMLAQRSGALIDAVEIDKEAAMQASENVNDSPWSSRIRIIYGSFQNFSSTKEKYDLIVSNPPYFINSLKTPDEKRSWARHNQQLNMEELIEGIVSLLDQPGVFSIILPVKEYELFKNLAASKHLYEKRRVLVSPSPGKPVKRVLSEYSFHKAPIQESSMIIEKYGRHKYSEEYIALTQQYYLKL